MRISIMLIYLMIPPLLYSQIKIKTYTTATDTFYWKHYESVDKPKKASLRKFVSGNSNQVIQAFIAGNLELFPQFTNDSVSRFGLKDLKKSLYPVDINGDGLPDMIFSGFSGGESDITRIFLNRGDTFELVFEDYQYITSLTLKEGKLMRMVIADPGCCDAYLYFRREFSVVQDRNALIFVKGKQTVEYNRTQRPMELLSTPFRWTSLYDTLLIRASAALIDDPYNPYMETAGNIIAGYTQKVRGEAIARQRDTFGREWLFVEIIPEIRPAKSIFYEIEKYPTFIRGWVNRSEIKISQPN